MPPMTSGVWTIKARIGFRQNRAGLFQNADSSILLTVERYRSQQSGGLQRVCRSSGARWQTVPPVGLTCCPAATAAMWSACRPVCGRCLQERVILDQAVYPEIGNPTSKHFSRSAASPGQCDGDFQAIPGRGRSLVRRQPLPPAPNREQYLVRFDHGGGSSTRM